MPWNFGGYANPDNPNYFEQGQDPMQTFLGGTDTVPPGFNTPPGGGDDPFSWFENIDQGGGGSMPTIPGVNLGGGTDPLTEAQGGGNWWENFDLAKLLQGLPKNILDLMPGSNGSSIAAGLMIPSWLSAYKQWEDSGKYSEVAKEAAKYGDPFGQANREYYQQQLKNSYENPDAFLNDPGHQAKLKSGLDQVSRQDAMKGYLGSGNMAADLSAYTANLNNQFLDQERARLMGLTGAQFNPAAAGEFLMKGNEQEIASQNAALQALMYPFLMNAGENHINNNNGGGSGGGQNGNNGQNGSGNTGGGQAPPVDWSKHHTDPASIARQIQQISGGMGGSAMSIINKLLNDPYFELDPSTASILQSISTDPAAMGELQGFFPETGSGLGGGYGMFPSPGGASYPAPGYNPFGPSDWELEEGGLGSVSYGPGLEFEYDMTDQIDPVPDWDSSEAWDFSGGFDWDLGAYEDWDYGFGYEGP